MPVPFTRTTKHLIAMSTLIPVSLLWERYSIDPFTGALYRLSDGKELKGQHTQSSKGYAHKTLAIHWNGTRHHKSYGKYVYAWITGSWGDQIDHIDRNPFNNQPWNLRDFTPRQNRKNSPTFHGGFYKHNRLERWYARIWHNGKHHSLGGYDSPEAARSAYKAALSQIEGQTTSDPFQAA